MKPSEYFARNCWIGASFPSPVEGKARDADRHRQVHVGQRLPAPRRLARRSRARACAGAFADVEPAELHQIFAVNAAEVYGFDLDKLAPLAAQHGPTVAEIAEPYEGVPKGATSPCFFQP